MNNDGFWGRLQALQFARCASSSAPNTGDDTSKFMRNIVQIAKKKRQRQQEQKQQMQFQKLTTQESKSGKMKQQIHQDGTKNIKNYNNFISIGQQENPPQKYMSRAKPKQFTSTARDTSKSLKNVQNSFPKKQSVNVPASSKHPSSFTTSYRPPVVTIMGHVGK